MNVASTCAHKRILHYYNDIHFFSLFNTFIIIIMISLGLFPVLGVFFYFYARFENNMPRLSSHVFR